MRKKKDTPPDSGSLEENLRWLLGRPAGAQEGQTLLQKAGLETGSWGLALALALVRKAAGGDLAAIREVRSLAGEAADVTGASGLGCKGTQPVQIVDDIGQIKTPAEKTQGCERGEQIEATGQTTG